VSGSLAKHGIHMNAREILMEINETEDNLRQDPKSNGGVQDYAQHEVTDLLCPPRNPKPLADSILRLLRDD
jgi:hypothetical protein